MGGTTDEVRDLRSRTLLTAFAPNARKRVGGAFFVAERCDNETGKMDLEPGIRPSFHGTGLSRNAGGVSSIRGIARNANGGSY